MNTQNLALGLVVVAVALAAGWFGGGFNKPTETTIKEVITEKLGATPGNDLQGPCVSVNGVVSCFFRPSFTSATTVPMSFQTPNATTTLTLGSGCYFSVASTSAKAVRVTKGAAMGATTTLLYGANIAASASGDVVATTTTNDFLIAPKQWIQASLVGGTGVDSPAGSCAFELRQVQG